MGTRTIASLKTSLAVEKVYHTDMLEQVNGIANQDDGEIILEFGPFEVITLRLKVKGTWINPKQDQG